MKYILILLVSVLFFALTYASAPTEFPFIDLFFISLLSGLFIGLECLIVWRAAAWRAVQNLLVVSFITLNCLSLNLIVNETYVVLPGYLQAGILIAAALIFYFFVHIIDSSTSSAKALLWMYVFAIAAVIISAQLSLPPIPDLLASKGKTTADNLKLVKFKSTPNVYFIAFDSLLPQSIMRDHLGIDHSPYHEVLDEHFRRFPNFFADYPNTLPSLNSILALDIEHFSEAVENKTDLYFFTGIVPSPLLEIFKNNGYETTTSYQALYMGHKKGPHVDNYRVSRWDLREGACKFLEIDGIRAITLAGYCYLVNERHLEWAFMKAEGTTALNEIEFLLDYMREGLRSEVPQFFVSYVFSPGHTFLGFNMENTEDLEKYLGHYRQASEIAAGYLRQLVQFIAEEDPEAIVYIFGDHGPHLSRRSTLEEEPHFIVTDNLGVYGGIHPKDRCAETFATPYSADYMTVSQGALMIIKCLAGGEDAYIKKREYRLPEEFVTGGKDRYEDYLYE